MTSVSIRISGANGEGLESSGALLAKVAARNGLHVFGHRGYQSIIRGGHVWYQVRVSDEKLLGHGEGADILVALNQDSITYQRSHLHEGATIIYDPSKVSLDPSDLNKFKALPIPLLDIAMKTGGDAIMRNVVAIGAVLGLVGIDIKVVDQVLSDMFSKKGQQAVDGNIRSAAAGYGYEGVKPICNLEGDGRTRYVIDGNSALSVGAFAGGCKFYAAYPMTPATGILHWFAAHEDKGAMFKQTEDEIAAINMAIGAAHAGARSMCGTSGGGFSLMVEALGMAGMMEVPIVVVNSQRTGPSTGLPSKTEQGDLLFVMHASQGEFPRIVVAPRSVDECYVVGRDAFNLSDRYQCPVLILLDQYLSEHISTVDGFNFDSITVDRGKVASAAPVSGRFKRYELTDDGISPRAFPGTPGTEFVATSYERDEYGDLVSDVRAGIDEHVAMRKRMQEKRMGKIATMLKNETVFVPEVLNEGAEYYLVAFGSTAESAEEAVELLKAQGLSFGLISFGYLMPLDGEKTKAILSGKKLIDVECNFTAQLAQVVKSSTGIDIQRRILRYDGEPMTGDWISAAAKEEMKNLR